jgi:alanine-synthesizing transaminase
MTCMRRNIVHPGADSLHYEIRSIVGVGHHMQKLGRDMVWENIGDPIAKGEKVAPWLKKIVASIMDDSKSWGYCDSQGEFETREVLAKYVNDRGGVQVSADDILFFNGLGDAITRLFSSMRREARILGPSPAYSTHSSAEAAHSGYDHLTYRCDPSNGWLPDVEDIRNKVKYNDTITGILLISPNNPTGVVYPRSILEEIVEIARQYDLVIINDEIYSHIVYNGAETVHLSEVLGDVPGIAMRGISKEFPWPGSRCGWIEVLNHSNDSTFGRYFKSLIDSKMLEVCSTTLPQKVIQKVYEDELFIPHLNTRAKIFEKRANEACAILNKVDGISAVTPSGAFYLTVTFNDKVLDNINPNLAMSDSLKGYFNELMQKDIKPDHRFVYFLMAQYGICVVPLSSFCCDYMGFRMTLLEWDDSARLEILSHISDAIRQYLK